MKGGRLDFSQGCDVPRPPKWRTSTGVHNVTSSQGKARDYLLLLAAKSCHSRGVSHRLASPGTEDCLNKTPDTTAINGFVTEI